MGAVRTVACIGDSITRGTFVWRRHRNSYPVRLQAMLGDAFTVADFGVNGHAAQRSADLPYWNSRAFHESARFRPDVALIMLGTNDCRGDNWKGRDPFVSDYSELVGRYLSLESDPAVWLLTPPALFRLGRGKQVRYGMDERALAQIREGVAGVAQELGCGLIDVYAATVGHPEAFRFDGVHPDAAGARLIAETVFGAIGPRDPAAPRTGAR